MLNIMVGLRKSIKSLYDLNICLQIREDHFTEEHEFMLGNKSLNGKQLETFRNLEIFKFI